MLAELLVLELLVLAKLLVFRELSDVTFLHLLVFLVLLGQDVPVLVLLRLGLVLVQLVVERLVDLELALVLVKPEFFLDGLPGVFLLGGWLCEFELVSLLYVVVLLDDVMESELNRRAGT